MNILFKMAIFVTLSLALTAASAFSQTTAFNFQGRLNDGTSPANGRYDLQFKLFDAITGGSQVGPTVDKSNTMLVNGVFSTALDFGAAAFNGADRFVEISVRPNGSPNTYVVLGARQQILSVPFSVRAANATQAGFASTAANATTAQDSISLGGVTASSYARLNFGNQGDVVGANVGSNGYLSVQGNAFQPESSFGFVKAMVAVTAGGALARCYNGITGSTSCSGFSAFCAGEVGRCEVGLPVGFSNRFWLVNPDSSFFQTGSEQVTANVGITVGGGGLRVFLWKNGTPASLPFHLFVF